MQGGGVVDIVCFVCFFYGALETIAVKNLSHQKPSSFFIEKKKTKQNHAATTPLARFFVIRWGAFAAFCCMM